MSLVPPINSAATLILQQSKISPIPLDNSTSPNDDIIAAANGTRAREEAKDVKTADDYWGVFQTDPTQMKVQIFKALGEAFGFDIKDFGSMKSYGEAIRAKVEKMRTTPEGRHALADIEKKLGLSELGISLDTLIEAVIDPEGAANDELEAALAKQSEKEDELAEAVETLGSIEVDGNGLYNLKR